MSSRTSGFTLPRFLCLLCLFISFLFAIKIAHTAPLIPQVQNGINWLKAQQKEDGSITGETKSIAVYSQGRIETAQTLRVFGETLHSALGGGDTTDYNRPH